MPAGPIIHHPFAFKIGALQITGFGIAVLLAFVLGQIVMDREYFRRGRDPVSIANFPFAAFAGTLVGAKLYFAVLNGDMSLIWGRSGFVFWGGLFGGLVFTAVYILWKKLPYWQIADVAALGLAAGYAVGRTGCWAVGDDYGLPWPNGWLAVQFPQGSPPSTAGRMLEQFGTPVPAGASLDTVLAVHPTQLYEVTLGILMFLVLWRFRKHPHAAGWLFGLYGVLAGIERFIVEIFRAKDDRFFGALTMAQMIALGFVVAGVVVMWMFRRVERPEQGIYAVPSGAGKRARAQAG